MAHSDVGSSYMLGETSDHKQVSRIPATMLNPISTKESTRGINKAE